MSERHVIPQMDEFRDELRSAGERLRDEPGRRRPRRSPRRLAVVIVGLVASAGAVAGAAQLIAVGDPVPQTAPAHDAYRPGNRIPVVVVRARDPQQPLPWGVAVYDTDRDTVCVISGLVRGSTLGLVASGTFRPYAAGTPGPCGPRPDADRYFIDIRSFDTDPPRTLVYGRAGARVRQIRLRTSGVVTKASVGPAGAFLFVLDERPTPRSTVIETYGEGGKLLTSGR